MCKSINFDAESDENDFCGDESKINPLRSQEEISLKGRIRRAVAAASGGTLIVFGAILTPVTLIPGGIPLMIIGLHVLAEEFEQAKEAKEKFLMAYTQWHQE